MTKEYRCKNKKCNTKFSKDYISMKAERESDFPTCPECGSEVKPLISLTGSKKWNLT